MRSRFAKRLGIVTRPFRRLKTYGPMDRRRLFWAMGRVVWIDVLLRRGGLKRCQERLMRAPPPSALFADVPPREIARVTEAAARYTLGSKNSCLRRSLLLWWILTEQGIACDVMMGLKPKTEAGLTGHAWVEIDGEVINDTADVATRYGRLRVSAGDLAPAPVADDGLAGRPVS